MSDNVLRRASSFKCRHGKFLIDSQLATIECGQCNEKLNPIWVLSQFMQKENSYNMQIERLKKVVEKAEKKNSCKCEHCSKMTRIQR